MALKKRSIAKIGGSVVGAAAVLAAANGADALYRSYQSTTDIVVNLATKPLTSSIFGISGYNGGGAMAANVTKLSGGSRVSVTVAGLSLYAKAYARCYTDNGPGGTRVYGAVYSEVADESGEVRSAYCSWLPSGIGPWNQVSFGAIINTGDDSSIAKTSRNICDGQGCGTADGIKVANSFLSYYPTWSSTPTGIASPSVPGPTNPCTACFNDSAW